MLQSSSGVNLALKSAKILIDSLDQAENRIVALKVIDVDSHDYKVNAREKDDSIEVTLHEIKVLKQLKDAKTKNVNVIFDAFQIHSQLWIVNEYCPGGSVRTLVSLVFVGFFDPFPVILSLITIRFTLMFCA